MRVHFYDIINTYNRRLLTRNVSQETEGFMGLHHWTTVVLSHRVGSFGPLFGDSDYDTNGNLQRE